MRALITFNLIANMCLAAVIAWLWWSKATTSPQASQQDHIADIQSEIQSVRAELDAAIAEWKKEGVTNESMAFLAHRLGQFEDRVTPILEQVQLKAAVESDDFLMTAAKSVGTENENVMREAAIESAKKVDSRFRRGWTPERWVDLFFEAERKRRSNR